jgi:hypothetical protein
MGKALGYSMSESLRAAALAAGSSGGWMDALMR